eukprot:m.231177 g.231177  ORF g.231177 m.231177 type:complete len:731 (-) comp15216_c0_seq1:2435-4627(-)
MALFTPEPVEVNADPISDDYSSFQAGKVPLVIDHGSHTCKVGWATEDKPRLAFPPILSKPKTVKGKSRVYVGNNATAAFAQSKQTARSSMEGGLIVQWDLEEKILDHAFTCLAIDGNSVDHPVVMTEPVCNPNFSRQRMNELLFECYQVPSVAYGVDALFSHFYNHPDAATRTSLVISSGHHATYALPVINGRMDAQHARRVGAAGDQIQQFGQSLFHARWPQFQHVLSSTVVESVISSMCHFSDDYKRDITCFEDVEYRSKHTRTIQLPADLSSIPTEEEIKQREERREQQSQRMLQMQAKRDEERLQEWEELLFNLNAMRDRLDEMDPAERDQDVQQHEYKDFKDFAKYYNSVIDKLRRARERKAKREETIAVLDDLEPIELPDEFDENAELMATADAELSASELKQKRRLVLMKTLQDAREREQEAKRAEKEQIERERLQDPVGWLLSIKAQRDSIAEELSNAEKESQKKAGRRQTGKRRAAGDRARLKLIVQQTQEEEGGKKQKRAKKKTKREDGDDDFGANDADWDVYAQMQSGADPQELDHLKSELSRLDSLISTYDTASSAPKDAITESQESREEMVERLQRANQFTIAAESIQIPEVIFQPTMAGIDQSGLGATFDFVFPRFSHDVQDLLQQNVFLTGGVCTMPGFQQRVVNELICRRPFQSTIGVTTAKDPIFDAWRGAAKFAATTTLYDSGRFTRAMYDEMGDDYLQEHFASNVFARKQA